MAKVLRGTAYNGEATFYLMDGTNLIQEIKDQRLYTPTAIAALGRSTMLTTILGLMTKDGASVTTVLDGGGAAGKIIVKATSDGKVKAKIDNSQVEAPKLSDTKLNVHGIVGTEGYLRVIKDLNMRDAFTSEVPIQTGEIAEDYAYYFARSEQIPTAVAAGVLVDRDQTIKNASSLVVQLAPGASEETITKLEGLFGKLTNISDELSEQSLEQFLNNKFDGDYQILGEEDIVFECGCSGERFLEALRMLGSDEIVRIKTEDKEIETVCDFCFSKYNIKTEEI